MAWREISPQDLNSLRTALLVDVRSPCEHEAERIPGSFNMPLLSDDERTVIGTIYKQQGDIPARRQALHMISPKIPGFVETVADMKRHGVPVVIYCWRGGMRSESIASMLSIAGIDCFRLTGGYKAWRGQVLKELKVPLPFTTAILHGFTGCGKTELLNELASRAAQVVDLERLANHRGSVFGGMGLGDQPTQKNFDSELWMQMRQFKSGVVFMEGESRKIGRISLPDRVFERIQDGAPILVTGSVSRRAQRITDDYMRNSDSERAIELLQSIKPRLGAARTEEIADHIKAERTVEAVALLLDHYYDPLYARQIERYSYVLQVDGDDVPKAASEILNWVQSQAYVQHANNLNAYS